MSEGSNRDGAAEKRPLGQKVKRTVESKVVIPLAATIVSAAASYLARKLPLILEEKVLPKLREKNAPETVTNVVEQTAATLGGSDGANGDSPRENGDSPRESQRAARGSGDAQGSGDDRGSGDPSSGPSSEEREEERRQREERRRERKKALK